MLWIKAVELTSGTIMFEGTFEQWNECFFYTGDLSEVIHFCMDHAWSVTFTWKS